LWPLFIASRAIFLWGVFLLFAAVVADEVMREVAPDTVSGLWGNVLARLLTPEYMVRAVSELGIAFLIASIVSFFIEATARREQTEYFEETLQRMGESVMEGLYHIRHEEAYVQAVISTCLAVQYIRTTFDIHYEIQEFSDVECDRHSIDKDQYVKISAELNYRAKNIGAVAGDFDGLYTCPTRPGMRDVAQMTSLDVGGKIYDDAKIAKLEVKKGERGYNSGDRTYRFPIPIDAGDTIPVRITAEFAKERFDTEVFAFLFPTMSASIRFTFHSVEGLDIGAKARTATHMPDHPKPVGSQIWWSINGPILPNDYVIVWWHEKAAQGELALPPAPDNERDESPDSGG
jgi:hypothetical protein